jgi:hypothetical protein
MSIKPKIFLKNLKPYNLNKLIKIIFQNIKNFLKTNKYSNDFFN